MPSTLLYALEERVRLDRLTEEHLYIDSPYNTYLYRGLPPGPVCNPGDKCIVAALEPDDVDYLYIIRTDETPYKHIFFENEEDYLEALGEHNYIYNRGIQFDD
jgi:UPF0755 protein